jgi:hypothetical protein
MVRHVSTNVSNRGVNFENLHFDSGEPLCLQALLKHTLLVSQTKV